MAAGGPSGTGAMDTGLEPPSAATGVALDDAVALDPAAASASASTIDGGSASRMAPAFLAERTGWAPRATRW